MKKIALKINFKKVDFKRILSKIICFKRLLFIIFFGMLIIATFNIVYKYAFLDIEYVDYVEDDSFIITDGKINNINLNRVLKNINKDKEKIEVGINKEYKDPFSFSGPEILNEVEYINEGENIDGGDLDDSEDLSADKNNESDNIISFEPQ